MKTSSAKPKRPRSSMVPCGPKPRYDWDEILKRGTRELVKGKHYKCTSHGMAQQVRNKAATPRYGVGVSIEVKDKSIIVTVS